MESKYINPKQVEITIKEPNKRIYEGSELREIEFNKDRKLSLGDYVDVSIKEFDTKFKINKFVVNKDKLIINEFEDNLSSTYILPFAEVKKDYLLVNNNLINCYVAHYDFSHVLGDYIYLIYRYTTDAYYSKFIKAIQKVSNCVHYVKEKDERFDCFVFKINDKFKKDINLILKGKYSKVSLEGKGLILNFHNQNHKHSKLYQILHKGELRKKELEDLLGCVLPDNIDYDEMPNMINEKWNYCK